MKIPKDKPVGKFYYAVEHGLHTVSFTNKRDAEAFARLLSRSVEEYKSDIVKREVTDEGFYLH